MQLVVNMLLCSCTDGCMDAANSGLSVSAGDCMRWHISVYGIVTAAKQRVLCIYWDVASFSLSVSVVTHSCG